MYFAQCVQIVMDCVSCAYCPVLCALGMHCRERKAIDLENIARYTALKARWKTLDVAVSNDYVPSHDLFYLEGQEEETDGSQRAEAKTDKGKAEEGTLLKMLDITARVCRQSLCH